jgi:hypothetical protein
MSKRTDLSLGPIEAIDDIFLEFGINMHIQNSVPELGKARLKYLTSIYPLGYIVNL